MSLIKPNPLVRLMPSLTDVAFLMPVVFLFTRMEGLRSLLGDGDTGFHIRAGDWIRAHGAVPQQDIFSFTMPDQPWFAWEWLWDVGASFLHEKWGLGGVALANLFLISLTFALLYRLLLRRCGNSIVSIGLTVLATAGSTIHWLARPHLVTLLLTVVFMAILERVREGKTALLWWLPVLTVAWTNLHGGFIVGIVILGTYAIGFLLRAAVAADRQDRMAAAKASLPYLAAAAGCLAASLVNPYFYELHVHIVKYLGDSYSMNHIQEFQSANFHHSMAFFLETMLVLGTGAAAWLALRKQFAEALLIAVWAHGALIAARNIPIFMIIAAPAIGLATVACFRALQGARMAAWLSRFLAWFEETAGDILPIEQIRRVHLVSAAVLVAIGIGMNSPRAGLKLKADYDPKGYPDRALAILNPSQRVFTNDEWGDYLIYRLSPVGLKVYVDGRSDFYGEKFGEAYGDVMNVKYDWEKQLRQYGVDTILLPVATPLTGAVKESRNWRVVYDDGSAIIFRPVALAAAQGQEISTGGVIGDGDSNGREGRGGNVKRLRSILSEGRQFQTSGGQKL